MTDNQTMATFIIKHLLKVTNNKCFFTQDEYEKHKAMINIASKNL